MHANRSDSWLLVALFRQVQNLKADEKGDQNTGIKAGIDTDFTNDHGWLGNLPVPLGHQWKFVKFVSIRGFSSPRRRRPARRTNALPMKSGRRAASRRK